MRDVPRLWWAVGALGLFAAAALFFTFRPDRQERVSGGKQHVTEAPPAAAVPTSDISRGSRSRRTRSSTATHKVNATGDPSQGRSVRASIPAPDWAATPADQMDLIHFPDPEKAGPYADRPTPGMAQFGEPASARVTVAGRSFALEPNQAGEFQRVYVGRNSKVSAEISYPGAGAGAPVFAEVLDGGRFADGAQAKRLTADARGKIGFDFQTDADFGTYRVLLRLGDDEKTLDIWVGPPLAVRAAR